jgi:predicted permease
MLDQVRIEPAALGWTMLIALGTGLVFGLAPAVFATSRGMTDGLKTGARDTEGRAGARVCRSSIIVAEIALSVMLLVGAGLLVRSFRAMETVDLGFSPSGLTSVTLHVGRAIPRSHRRAMVAALLQRLRETPGIHGVVLATSLPPQIFANGDGLQPVDRAASDVPLIATSGSIGMQPGFFATAGIRVRGRTFDADSTGMDSLPPHEIIVNERLARRLWRDVDAIGQRVRVGTTTNTVVGVANDLTIPGLSGDQFELQFYTPWFADSRRMPTVIFRSELGDRAIDAAVREAMRRISPQLSIMHTATSDEELRVMLAPMKFATALVSGFAVIALLLSVVGLYGVIAYAVSQRTREIGVRIALGAQRKDIARLVLVRGSLLVGAGLLSGIAMSAAGSRVLQAYLYGVSGRDPLTYTAIVVLLGAAAVLAAYLPARRAMRIDPVVALSAE